MKSRAFVRKRIKHVIDFAHVHTLQKESLGSVNKLKGGGGGGVESENASLYIYWTLVKSTRVALS